MFKATLHTEQVTHAVINHSDFRRPNSFSLPSPPLLLRPLFRQSRHVCNAGCRPSQRHLHRLRERPPANLPVCPCPRWRSPAQKLPLSQPSPEQYQSLSECPRGPPMSATPPRHPCSHRVSPIR